MRSLHDLAEYMLLGAATENKPTRTIVGWDGVVIYRWRNAQTGEEREATVSGIARGLGLHPNTFHKHAQRVGHEGKRARSHGHGWYCVERVGETRAEATFWWLLRTGSSKCVPPTGPAPEVQFPELVAIALYRSGLGVKAALERMGVRSGGTQGTLSRWLEGCGGIDRERRSPTWDSGPRTNVNETLEDLATMRRLEGEHGNWWRKAYNFTPEWKRAHERMKRTPALRTKFYLRKRLRKEVKGAPRVSLRSVELFGCTPEALRWHLEHQFLPGMTWENHGSAWHIDHKVPCARFDLTKTEEAKRCFHYSNLRPLWAADNLSKSARILPEFAHLVNP